MKLFGDFLFGIHDICDPFYSWLDSLPFIEQLLVYDLIASFALWIIYSTFKRILPILNGGGSHE